MAQNLMMTLLLALLVSISPGLQAAQAEPAEPAETTQSEQSAVDEPVVLDQAELDTILAPIALYPDTLLSHILVASTYPLEVVQAARWREANEDLDSEQVQQAMEDKDWDPSVKALAPFNSLLQKMSEDLDWLQALGDAFLANEEQLLASIQGLRQKAYEAGNLADNDYIDVEQDKEQIIIETVQKEVVYVPYYDTRVVYGPWWHHHYSPVYWHYPPHHHWHAGFYWGPSIHIGAHFYFGGFHWHNRYVVVRPPHYYHTPVHHRYPDRHHYKVVKSREYQRWTHNPEHRRGVRYQTQRTISDYGNYQRVGTTEISRSTNARHTTTRTVSHENVQRQLKLYSAKSTHQGSKSAKVKQGIADGKSYSKGINKAPVTLNKQKSYSNVKAVSAPKVQSQKNVTGMSGKRDVMPVKSGKKYSTTGSNNISKSYTAPKSVNRSYSSGNKGYSAPKTSSPPVKTYSGQNYNKGNASNRGSRSTKAVRKHLR